MILRRDERRRSSDLVSPLDRIRRKLRARGGESANAAVAIIFREGESELELFLVKRAEVPGDPWSGDMAFPGGKRIPQDRNIVHTVVREVKEETNIDLETNLFLGKMEIVFSTVRPDYSVLPLVFLQETDADIKINEELTSYLWAPYNKLEGSRDRTMIKNLTAPVFRVKGEVVWGLTYRIIENLLELAR
jgi:8-oxo-dGTP pyrophosphatase MutT (NUDIX family)